MAWKTTIKPPVLDQTTADKPDAEKQYTVDVIYTSDITGNQYAITLRMAAKIEDFNTQLSLNLAAFQSQEAFLNLQEGDYSLEQNTPSLSATLISQSPVTP